MSLSAHALFTVDDVSVGRGGRRIVEAASFTIAAGERVGLVGPSGGGKTTLLRALALLISPSSGRVMLNGEVPADADVPGFRARVVYVPQRPLMVTGTVEANLRLPFDHASVGKRFSWPGARASALLAALGLPERLTTADATTLSMGQQQRVALVRALLLQPRVVLLDEPTSGLDEDAAAQILTLLRRVSDDDRVAVLIASHRGDQLAQLCHRVIDLTPHLRGHLQ